MADIGQFVGGIVATAVLTAIFTALLCKHLTPIVTVLVANLLSLVVATIVAGFGFANGRDPNFTASFAQYALPQLVWLFVSLIRANRGPEKPVVETTARRDPPLAAKYIAERIVEEAISAPPAPAVSAPKDDNWHSGNLAPPPAPAAVEMPSGNFIKKHWRGQLSLGMSYWGIAALGNVTIAILGAVLAASLSVDKGYAPSQLFWALVAIWIVVAVIVVWQTVGTWRAATNHAARQVASGKGTGWATAAKVALIFGFLSNIGQFTKAGVPQVSEAYDIAFNGDPSIESYSLRLMRNGTEIEVVGGFKYGLTNDFESVFRASPQIRVVHLHSNGGRIGEGERLFNAIKARGLMTYVPSLCQSACTLAYAGGKERWIARGGQLGFHGPAFPGMTATDFSDVIRNWKGLLVGQGVVGTFVDKALAVPSVEMWRPTLPELTAARVVTNVATGSEFAASGYGKAVTKEAIAEQLVKYLPALAAMRTRLPADFAGITDTYFDAYRSGQTEAQLITLVRGKIMPVIEAHKAKADDAVLIDYARVAMEQYMAIGQRNPTMCYRYAAFGGSNLNISAEVPPALIERELALGERVIATSAPRPPQNDKIVGVLATRLGNALAKRFPPDQVALLQSTTVQPARHGDYCNLAIAMYQEILAMRPPEAGMLLRSFQTQ